MSAGPSIRRPPFRAGAAGAAAAALVALYGAALAVVLYLFPPPTLLAVAAGLGLLGILAVAVARYEAAVVLGIALLAVVKTEPAPPDAVLGIVMAVAIVTGRFDLQRVPLTVGALVGLFLVLNVMSALDAVDLGQAALFFTITLYLVVFSLWFAGYVDSFRRTRHVVIAYVGSAVVSAILGASALLVAYPGAEVFLENEDMRASALFRDPNVFGPFLVPAALILLEELLRPRLLRLPGWLKSAMFLALVLGVVLSYSRAAWANLAVGLGVMLALLALRRGGGARVAKLVAATAIALAVVATVLVQSGSVEFLEQRASLQPYDQERFSAQRYGLEVGAERPFGIGPGQFELLAPAAAHSTYVRALGEQGVLGFLAIFALLFATLVFAGRNAVIGRDTYGLGSAALFGAWAGIMVNSFVVDTLHWRHLWFVAALIWAGTMRPAAARTGDEAP